ncbi:Putative ribonuclease H protein At1g65750 [Linum perenne]
MEARGLKPAAVTVVAGVTKLGGAVTHGKLMTNEERRQRHVSPDAIGPECQGGCEDREHVLRSCSLARSVWRNMMPEVLEDAMRMLPLPFLNGGSRVLETVTPAFLSVLSLGCFGVAGNAWCLGRKSYRFMRFAIRLSSGYIFISSSWKALQASREAPKLRAIVEGMKLAWNKGIRRLRIQTDSKDAVTILSKPYSVNNQHASLIAQLSELSSSDWQVSIHHIYRKANYAADHLANLGHSLDLGVHLFDFPDVSLQYWLRFDLFGSCTPRLISNTT